MNICKGQNARGFCFAMLVVLILVGACSRQVPAIPTVTFDATDANMASPGLTVDVSGGAVSDQTSQFVQIRDTVYWDISVRTQNTAARILAARVPSNKDAVHIVADTTGPVRVRVLFGGKDALQEKLAATRVLAEGHHDFEVLPSGERKKGKGG